MRQVFIVVFVFVFTFALGFCASPGRAQEPAAMPATPVAPTVP
jgi:hypothetical protein